MTVWVVFTHNTCDTQCIWAFPHQATLQFSVDINRVSYNSVLTLTTPQVKGSVHQDYRYHLQVPGCHLYFWLTDCKFRVPLHRFNYLLELIQLKKACCLHLLEKIQFRSRWKRCVGQGVGEGAQRFHAPSGHTTLPALQCVCQDQSWSFFSGFFLWSFITYTRLINHRLLVIDLNL